MRWQYPLDVPLPAPTVTTAADAPDNTAMQTELHVPLPRIALAQNKHKLCPHE